MSVRGTSSITEKYRDLAAVGRHSVLYKTRGIFGGFR